MLYIGMPTVPYTGMAVHYTVGIRLRAVPYNSRIYRYETAHQYGTAITTAVIRVETVVRDIKGSIYTNLATNEYKFLMQQCKRSLFKSRFLYHSPHSPPAHLHTSPLPCCSASYQMYKATSKLPLHRCAIAVVTGTGSVVVSCREGGTAKCTTRGPHTHQSSAL